MSNFDNIQTVNKIKELLKSQGRSLTFMYKVLNLPVGYLRDVKAKKTVLTDERLQTIADFLNTTTEYLKGETDTKEKAAPISGNGLSENEIKLIKLWRSFSPDEQKTVLKILSALRE